MKNPVSQLCHFTILYFTFILDPLYQLTCLIFRNSFSNYCGWDDGEIKIFWQEHVIFGWGHGLSKLVSLTAMIKCFGKIAADSFRIMYRYGRENMFKAVLVIARRSWISILNLTGREPMWKGINRLFFHKFYFNNIDRGSMFSADCSLLRKCFLSLDFLLLQLIS